MCGCDIHSLALQVCKKFDGSKMYYIISDKHRDIIISLFTKIACSVFYLKTYFKVSRFF